ncbi:MAG: type IV secretion system protein [Burkholderiaceae bacterium]|nr:MAG: type IV secretion system protein [Burkholderiaceae bacterium]TBR76179.1 MAG: type IV secretion system protein [Burkholderiaceae bacterium]
MQPTARKAKSPQPRQRAAAAEVLGDVPGPYAQAALQHYYERGSKEVIERNNWRTLSFVMAGALLLCAAAFWQLIPLKTVQTALVSEDSTGRAQVRFAGGNWTPDANMKAAWLADWTQALTEVNAATWERSIAKVTLLSIGTARDQIRDYLHSPGNQPAVLLKDKPTYVREFQLRSVNTISENVILIRYTLTSWPSPGSPKQVDAYALTATLATEKPESSADALANPTGLVVSNFNIAQDTMK